MILGFLGWLKKSKDQLRAGLAIRRARKQWETDMENGYDPKVSIAKGVRSALWFAVWTAIGAFLMSLAQPGIVEAFLMAAGVKAAYIGVIAMALRGAATAGGNWWKNSPNAPTLPPANPDIKAGALGGAFLMFALLPSPARASEPDLWLAANAAGARESAQEISLQPVPVEAIADDFGRDMAWLVGSHAADLYSTAWAIERCDGRCGEGNLLGPTSEARVALKMASAATTGLTMWKLRRDGHGRSASIVRWSYVALNSLLVINNSVHAIRGK